VEAEVDDVRRRQQEKQNEVDLDEEDEVEQEEGFDVNNSTYTEEVRKKEKSDRTLYVCDSCRSCPTAL